MDSKTAQRTFLDAQASFYRAKRDVVAQQTNLDLELLGAQFAFSAATASPDNPCGAISLFFGDVADIQTFAQNPPPFAWTAAARDSISAQCRALYASVGDAAAAPPHVSAASTARVPGRLGVAHRWHDPGRSYCATSCVWDPGAKCDAFSTRTESDLCHTRGCKGTESTHHQLRPAHAMAIQPRSDAFRASRYALQAWQRDRCKLRTRCVLATLSVNIDAVKKLCERC